jgi:DNA-binding NarL/FixJ family response regulator
MRLLKIFIADDHALIREGLKRLVDSAPDLEVIGEAADGAQACTRVAALRPDVLLLDLSMPRMSGVEAARQITRECPDTKVLGLTVHEDPSYLRELLEAGAAGYVLKRSAPDELVSAIRSVAQGGVYVDPRVASVLIGSVTQSTRVGSNLVDLSSREVEVTRLLARGYSNKEIAAQLNLSVKTVETYKARSMEKLGLKSRVDLIRLATERGWLTA